MKLRLLLPMMALACGSAPCDGSQEAWEEHEARRAQREREAEEARRRAVGPRAVPCPKCDAPIGQECRRDNRKHRFHKARILAQPVPAGSREVKP